MDRRPMIERFEAIVRQLIRPHWRRSAKPLKNGSFRFIWTSSSPTNQPRFGHALLQVLADPNKLCDIHEERGFDLIVARLAQYPGLLHRALATTMAATAQA